MENVYFGEFAGVDDMLEQFEIESAVLDGLEILHAHYSNENYEGNAFVLYRKDNKLYEVNADHCSCYGLERQWDPEETTAEAVSLRSFDYLDDDVRFGLMKLLSTL